ADRETCDDEARTCEVGQGHMRRKPLRDQSGSSTDELEMRNPERDEGRAIEHSRNAHAAAADEDTKPSPVTLVREPRVQDPSSSYHHRVSAGCPVHVHAERVE